MSVQEIIIVISICLMPLLGVFYLVYYFKKDKERELKERKS